MLRTSINQRRDRRVRIDLSPMIDCIFILLIFFIVTSVFVEDPGIEVNKPDVQGSEVQDRDALLIAITADDRIFFDGREIPLDQVTAIVRQATFSEDAVLIIRADESTSHGMFAGVYAEAKRAGIPQVQFATESTDSF